MESTLSAFSNELAALASRAAGSVVAVNGRRRSHSSGVQWRDDLIVTAEHTLRRDEDITVTAAGGKQAAATLLGRDPGTDIALLKAEGLGVPAAQVAAGGTLRVGDLTLVVGRSPNSGHNASLGIISAVSGPWRTWRGGSLDAYIRLGAPVFAGSSGGAVVDAGGFVTGIATSALSRVAGLSVPAATVTRVVDELLAHGSVPQAYLGVALQVVPMPGAFRERLKVANTHGIMVLDVEQGGPAEKGGILVGDIVFAVEGTEVATIEEVQTLTGRRAAGTAVALKTIRGGEVKEISVTLGERPRRTRS